MFTRAKIYNGDTYLKNHLRANDYFPRVSEFPVNGSELERVNLD